MTETRQQIRIEREGDVAVLVIDNPPVNAMTPDGGVQLVDAIEACDADPAIKAMVMIGHGRSFIAGFDIRAFGKNRPAPRKRTYEALDDSSKPVIAAIHGYALGGGLEVALACHYRIAVPSAKLGLPEVALGLLPGGGGTQRLPRLIGAKAALDLITSGRHVPAAEALKFGLIDELVEGDLRQAGIAFARKVAGILPPPRVRDREAKAEPGTFDDIRKSIARKAKGQRAPYACIEAVEAAYDRPFKEGEIREAELFREMENSDESKALRYAFFAEREANKLPDVPKETPVRAIASAAVIGAGTMGGGIAMCFADFGVPVKIMDATPEALEKGLERVRANYAASVKRGSLTEAESQARIALITPIQSYDEIGDADVVIEAVFERMDLKKTVFAELDRVMKPGSLILTNSSALNIDEIATATKRPQDVSGAHFFSPANAMKLLEVVKGAKSSPETIASVMQMGKKIGKISVACGNCDGFVANRSRVPFSLELNILIEDGASPAEIDKVMTDFGYATGPLAVGDVVGHDLGYGVRKRREADNPNARKMPILDAIYERGRLGTKNGKGWYRYEKGDRTPQPDPEVAEIIAEVRKSLGITPRSFSADEILRRILFASVNEACRIIDEGIVYRASDIDVMWLYGFGFPRWRGGLMFWADGIGAKTIYDQIAQWHQELGPRWTPAPLLKALAESGASFREAKPLPKG